VDVDLGNAGVCVDGGSQFSSEEVELFAVSFYELFVSRRKRLCPFGILVICANNCPALVPHAVHGLHAP
jgi:hypothetical protein